MKSCLLRLLTGTAAVLLAGLIAFVALPPLDREYALRLLRWGESDARDYLRFTERAIAAPGEPLLLPVDLHPEWFETVEYSAGGRTYRSSLDELMEISNTYALVILKDDKVVYEGYYNGNRRDSIVTSFSTAKSFNSALIGRAIADGLIGSVDDPIIQYLPELKGRGLDGMTLRDLLLMSSGIAYREDENMLPLLGAPFSDDALTYYYPDLRGLALRQVSAGSEPVGAVMHYNNYHPLLEGLILERVTGMPVAQYLEQTLWLKLGAEFPASWSLDSAATGFEKMESGINARAIDFARFGLLYLHGGDWFGQQVLPAAWVEESTAPDPADERPWPYWPELKEDGGYYKYHWWGYVRPDGHHDFLAAGAHGQYIYVCPQKNLVIARYGQGEGPLGSFRPVLWALEALVPGE